LFARTFERSAFVYASSVREAEGGGGSFTRNSESYVRIVVEGSGIGSFLSLWRLRQGHLNGGLLY